MNDILGQALYAYHFNGSKNKLWINNRYGARENMPVCTYFRGEEEMPDMEWLALEKCYGDILDIGAGAGSHSLPLQRQEKNVTSLDISALAVEVMQNRGVRQAITGDIFNYNTQKYDTLLLLMNGIGLAGTLPKLQQLLVHFKTLLKPGGQVLFDSSDIRYLYAEEELPNERYYGQIAYQYEYQRQKSEWFNWLYIDEQTMQKTVKAAGYSMEVLLEDDSGQYFARLSLADT